MEVLAKATEAAALAVWPHVGQGDLERVDRAAVDAMRDCLNAASLAGCIAIGEGEKDKAPMLHNGETVGLATGPALDLAVDPIDGTRAAATGKPGSVAALAAAPSGAMFRPTHVAYMEKLVGSPSTNGKLHLDMPIAEMLATVATAESIAKSSVRVAILDRPRNHAMMQAVREAGALVQALPYADLSASIAIALGTADLHLLLGIGGAPEGVLAATAAAAVGACMEVRLWPRNAEERAFLSDAGQSQTRILTARDMVGQRGLRVVLTGVTGSELVAGASESQDALRVHTVRISSDAPVRFAYRTLSRPPHA